MGRSLHASVAIGSAALLVWALTGCAASDNPTALAELAPRTEFELSVTRAETFEEIEIHAHVMEGGTPLHMTEAELEIEHESGGLPRIMRMEPDGDEWIAHITFYEPGEHHLHLTGTPERHRLAREMGDLELDVHRQHRIIGAHWVELEATPAPVPAGASAHLHLFVHEQDSSGERGSPLAGLPLSCTVHDPTGGEAALSLIEEEPGMHEAEHRFGPAGMYEIECEVEEGSEHFHADFHLPVLGESADEVPDEGDEGGHGH